MRFVSPCTVATLAAVGFAMQANAGDVVAAKPVAAAEAAFLDFLDAHGELGVVESGLQERYLGRDRAQWQALSDSRRNRLDAALGRLKPLQLRPADERAVQAMLASLAALASEDAVSNSPATSCKDAGERDLDYARLRAALVACYVEYGNALRFEDSTIDRGSALQLLHVIDEPARRRAVFDAFVPLWTALDGHGEPDSPYRRMIAMAAEAARKQGSPIDAAARALGVRETDVENWLVEVLDAWRQATGPQLVEPWDYRYVNSAANRELAARIPPESLVPANQRFYQDLGADLAALGVMYDLEPRAGKSPLAYTDFVTRGRTTGGRWQVSVARVVATYPTGGLYSLNELVHENGHAVHIAAIHNRPAYMDWPDTLFTEAFADVPSWSVYEPAWQRRYLGAAAAEPASLRALFGDVMLDVAWALFELRLLRDPRQDPNVLWTDITSRYLHVAPHPEVPWWAVRVQLVDEPGYMVNYGLGAVLTAEMRQRTVDAVGVFDAGNPGWYAYLSRQLLQYGSERGTRSLLQDLLGRPVSPAALIRQVARSGDAAASGSTVTGNQGTFPYFASSK
ncbi:MAG TPA: hypothetical protein PL152_00185 [Steroidobacteraceae bacterium]|nr:hypothetical protein [Steroidobacteraceae bacterium]